MIYLSLPLNNRLIKRCLDLWQEGDVEYDVHMTAICLLKLEMMRRQ